MALRYLLSQYFFCRFSFSIITNPTFFWFPTSNKEGSRVSAWWLKLGAKNQSLRTTSTGSYSLGWQIYGLKSLLFWPQSIPFVGLHWPAFVLNRCYLFPVWWWIWCQRNCRVYKRRDRPGQRNWRTTDAQCKQTILCDRFFCTCVNLFSTGRL